MTNSQLHNVSDLYKDAFGFRPSEDWIIWFDGLDSAQADAEVDSLITSLEEAMDREAKAEQRQWQHLLDRLSARGESPARAFWALMPELGLSPSDKYDGEGWAWQLQVSFDRAPQLLTWAKEGRPR